jgi:hypothetical protein
VLTAAREFRWDGLGLPSCQSRGQSLPGDCVLPWIARKTDGARNSSHRVALIHGDALGAIPISSRRASMARPVAGSFDNQDRAARRIASMLAGPARRLRLDAVANLDAEFWT